MKFLKNFLTNILMNFDFSVDFSLTYHLLTVASFRIGVPSILFLQKNGLKNVECCTYKVTNKNKLPLVVNCMFVTVSVFSNLHIWEKILGASLCSYSEVMSIFRLFALKNSPLVFSYSFLAQNFCQL